MATNTKRIVEEESGYDSGNEREEEDSSRWMRRREASDDDDDDDYGDRNKEEEEREEKSVRTDNRRVVFGFDDELNGVGGAPDEEVENSPYYDELEDFEEEECEVEEEEEKEKVTEVVSEMCKEEDEGQNWKNNNAPRVPRTGSFYMHDDRCGRRMTSGRSKLLEFKDERKWQHDKFAEMTLQESRSKKFNFNTKVHKTSDGNHQGCFGNQGRYYVDVKANQFKPNNNNNDKRSYSSRTRKGRGPVKYKPFLSSSYVAPLTGNKQSRKLPAINSTASSSSSGICVANTRDVQHRKTKGYIKGDNTRLPHSNEHLQGQNVTDYVGRNRSNAKESINLAVQSCFTNLPLQSSVTRSMNNSLPELMSHLSLTSNNKLDFFSPMDHLPAVQPTSSEKAVCSPLQAYNQQFSSHAEIGPQSFLIASSSSGYNLGMMGSFSTTASEMAWSARGSGTAEGCRRGSQCGETYSHQNFTTTIPFSTVQLRDQLAVGDLSELIVARYMAQPEVGFGNAGITGVSFLPDNVGGLTPNLNPNRGYCATSEQESSTGTQINGSGAGNPSKPPDGTERLPNAEVINSQYKQRRIKPERYSKMNFKQ